MSVGSEIESQLEALPGVSLNDLDERAALLRRTDTKYVLAEHAFTVLLRRLGEDHEVLEIDGRRAFGYESVYFDTSDLRCFRDHIEDRVPRFKARTRLYRDTSHCVFEVKLKLDRGETDKRQVDHAPEAVDQIDEDALRCLEQALEKVGVAPPPDPPKPSLRTTFTRVTLAPKDGRERTTCDFGIRLQRPAEASAELRRGLVVVESKSEGGSGPTDRALAEMGVEEVSFSKYRTGIALLAKEAEDPESRRRAERLFTTARG
jgi:VTC domain-containing protein